MEVKRSMAKAVMKQFSINGVVLTTNMRSGVFMTFDVDNLDSHSQGNFSQNGFHGKAISVTNHLSWDNLGVKYSCVRLDSKDASVPQLPESFSVVQPAELTLTSNDLYVPRTPDLNCRPSHNFLHLAKIRDEFWLAHESTVLEHDTFSNNEVITWYGFNSTLISDGTVKPNTCIPIC